MEESWGMESANMRAYSGAKNENRQFNLLDEIRVVTLVENHLGCGRSVAQPFSIS